MNWFTLSILLLGGLAIFLHGMTVMTEGLKAAAGNRMKLFLKKMTRNRWTSFLAGTGITSVIQSSSVTTVLAVGFVSAGLMSFQSTLGIILGANVGTTITAQIIAFKITKASWILVAFGYLFSVLFAHKSYKDFGSIILGLGLVFLGMNVMSEATSPLKNYAPFIDLMKGLDNYLLAILLGTVFTAAVQSSSASTGIVIILAGQQLIGVEAGIAIIMGANIGTCVTAVLSAIGKPKAAMRVAFSHVFFNVAGVVIWYVFIGQLADLVELISANNPGRQIANAHTIFNVANTVLFIWFVKPVSKLVLWVLPLSKSKKVRLFPELHSYYLESPSMAIELAHHAIFQLGERTLEIITKGLPVALVGNASELAYLRANDKEIDNGQGEILRFIQKIQHNGLSKQELESIENLIETVNIIESSADLITTNLVEAAEHRIEMGFESSAETIEKLNQLHTLAAKSFEIALQQLGDKPTKYEVPVSKEDFKTQFHEVRSHLVQRLATNDELRISIYRFESEVLETIRRLHAMARRLQRKADS